MKYKTTDVRVTNSHLYIGKIVWICHYLRPDFNKKPLRNLPPTRCIIRPISELPKNKRIYYSDIFFSPISESGKISSKIISPVDNTGFRSYPGNEINIFDSEEECIQCWNNELQIVINNINDEMKIVLQRLENQVDTLKSMIR